MTMLEKLVQQYPNAIVTQKPTEDQLQHFLWYQESSSNEMIGLPKSEITTNEANLIGLFLNKIIPVASSTHAAMKWDQYLFGDSNEMPLPDQSIFRFISFQLSQSNHYQEIVEPLHFVFSDDAVIVFRDATNGYVIELKSENSLTKEELASAAQALETDIDVKIQFFIGAFRSFGQQTKAELLQELKWFNESRNWTNRQTVITAEEIFPIVVLNHLSSIEKSFLFSKIFEAFQADPELSHVIRTYVENLSNASSTAKILYLHRNSLQYRLDKFSERTNIDLKSVHGSMYAYLACLEWEIKKAENVR
ncbi:PucR family transcriptional regulator [Jeotgalibacillus soli]|uniref:PucR C-terminal helix-turn-helix domain-containing protein n=1 Tax=Jeotgalibacillus soli TaxID=889306 RepID=A0A0C2VMB8_9BACL|nr:helix-turn-helix domain-containing protein [Jeotgalibacillus soli]KIL45581.1 hypothetical protein KP78_19300 [Jeotgalibacillus soli]